MWSRRSVLVVSAGLIGALLTACGGDAAPDGVVPDGTGGNGAVAFTIELSPEFVQGVIPGATTGVLVTVKNASATDVPVQLTAAAEGATVTVVPGEIVEGQVAEVVLVADPATLDETALELVVTGTRDGIEQSASRSTVVFPWEDDRGPYARQLLAVFTEWLAANEPSLGIATDTAFSGSFVAPGLLVVSHYLFLSDAWELGVSWHVMIAPDDWAEIYLRPREVFAPTVAFRLASQAAAFGAGTIEIAPVAPPVEVVR